MLFWSSGLLGNIFVHFVFHLRPSPDLLAFCEFSFGADMIIITDPPGECESRGLAKFAAPLDVLGRRAPAGASCEMVPSPGR